MKRKIESLCVCILLFLPIMHLSITAVEESASVNTIYVDDDGGADYTSIQEAINAASDGDTVFVYNGTYVENVLINKSINLQGEGRNNTVIDGDRNRDVVNISADRVTITGFTIQNSRSNGGNTGINVKSNFTTITSNTINGSDNGIYITNSFNSTIKNNKIQSSLSGIYLFSSQKQILSYNIVTDCAKGIYLEESSDNTVNSNHLTGNQEGLFCLYASDNKVQYNNFISNEENAKFAKFFHQDFLIPNKWKNNYWDDWIGFGVKCIPGIMYIPCGNPIGTFIPWMEMDWHPAKKPYELVVRIKVGPYTQNVNDNSITIVWETNIPTNDNYVMFGETTDYEHVEQGESNCYHHEITITPGFSSGYFKVASNDEESNDLKFKLASHCYNTQKFKCVILGDSRGVWDNWAHATEVANAVNAESPDFVIHGGDMVNDGTVLSEWDSWLTLMKPLMQNSTVFGVMGNHERKGSRYYEVFALPNNEKWYSFDYGPCHFTILDNYEPWNVGSYQYKWLEEDLAMTDKPIKIVCFHEPIYCSGGHNPRTNVRAAWEPLFNQYNVDLVFQSHCHYYQRTNPINGTIYVVTGGAGAPLYSPKDASFVNISEKAHHYCVLDGSLKTMEMTISARYINGTIFDEFVVC